MGLGMEAAQGRLDSYLLKSQNEKQRESFCYLRGDTRTGIATDGQSINWQGIGNFDQCYQHLNQFLDTKLCQWHKPEYNGDPLISKMFFCTPDGVPMPLISSNQPFYWIENFYYTARVLNIDRIGGDRFLNVLKEQGRTYCNLEKLSATQKFPHASTEEISKTCFCAAWLSVMIDSGFNMSSFRNYQVIRDINEVGIDWALGFLVEHSKEVSTKLSMPWALIGAFTLTGLLFVVYNMFKGRLFWSWIDRLKLLRRKQLNHVRYAKVSTIEN